MDNLIVLRKEFGKTQQDLADYLGISRQAYSNYESGRREPDYETLLKLGEYFNCSVDYLLNSGRVGRSFQPSMSPFELLLLEKYRTASPDMKNAVCKLLDISNDADETH